MTTTGELAGKTAVVTGSSQGIGRSIALELASAGADVLVHGRTISPALTAVVAEIRSHGHQVCQVAADLAQSEGPTQLVEQAWKWRDIDIWVNNAGADVLTGPTAKSSFDEKLSRLWHVDVVGTVRCSRATGWRMSDRGNGVILNIGWDQAALGMAGPSGEMFALTKGAIMAFTRSLAKTLAPTVRVNCLAPGWIRTAWGESASATWQRRAEQESLLGRWGTSQDVGLVARFLVSPAARFVTGQVIPVNGGLR